MKRLKSKLKKLKKMSYKLSIKNGDGIYTGESIGNAFTALDNWCHNNNAWYDFECIYHVFDNTIGIDVHMENGKIKQFTIVQS